jgi:hypothetical protein
VPNRPQGLQRTNLLAAAAAGVEGAYKTFFQGYWLAAVDGVPQKRMIFHGDGSPFFAVLRPIEVGAPIAIFQVDAPGGEAVVDLTDYTDRFPLVLYLFGQEADAQAYFDASAGGWSNEQLAFMADREMTGYIPDVGLVSQGKVRVARDLWNAALPDIVQPMIDALQVVYKEFTLFDGRMVPDLNEAGLAGLTVAAPGYPPEWIPPS